MEELVPCTEPWFRARIKELEAELRRERNRYFDDMSEVVQTLQAIGGVHCNRKMEHTDLANETVEELQRRT